MPPPCTEFFAFLMTPEQTQIILYNLLYFDRNISIYLYTYKKNCQRACESNGIVAFSPYHQTSLTMALLITRIDLITLVLILQTSAGEYY